MAHNQEIFDWLADNTGKIFVQSEINDLINLVHKHAPDEALSQPVWRTMESAPTGCHSHNRHRARGRDEDALLV